MNSEYLAELEACAQYTEKASQMVARSILLMDNQKLQGECDETFRLFGVDWAIDGVVLCDKCEAPMAFCSSSETSGTFNGVPCPSDDCPATYTVERDGPMRIRDRMPRIGDRYASE